MASSREAPKVAGTEKKPALRQGRPYQDQMVEYALKENTIVSLGTGAGKTFVAVMLIRELGHATKGDFTETEGQRIVFLAHTVPLVKQQADYIRENTNLKVSEFVGDAKGIDNWPKEIWYNHFNTNNVLVFSRAIFLDLLTKAFIKPRQLRLIVFDECHHATKNDPFVQIMKVVKDAPPEERPLILGLSASLLGQKVKPGELEKGVKDLESILMSRARTAMDLAEVVKYATNPEEKITHYDSTLDNIASRLKNILHSPLLFLQTKVRGRKWKYPIEETAKNLLDDLHHILVDLGPASAYGFVGQTIIELRKAIQYTNPGDKWEEHIGYLVLGQLLIFEAHCWRFKKEYGRLEDSKKVRAMLLEIADTGLMNGATEESEDSPDKGSQVKEGAESSQEEGEETPKKPQQSSPGTRRGLRGIIFAERRHTASCLAKLIQEKSKTEADLKHVSCDFVVGHNIGQNTTAMRKEARMKSGKQDEKLSKFRKGSTNLLVATSVIEEGVDVPRCNLVIRFDLPQNFRSYVQSKGRARDKPSKFLLLLSNEDSKCLSEIKGYHKLEDELVQLCQSDRCLPSEEEIQRKMADTVPPYMPKGTEGARVTVGNSLTLLHRYCDRLPQDDYSKLSPIFEVVKRPKLGGPPRPLSDLSLEEEEEDPAHVYICYLRLPINCPLKDTIESPPLGSKQQSQRAAALFAMKRLHQMNEVDDLFKAKTTVDSDDEDVKVEKKDKLAGTDKNTKSYKKKVPSVITACFHLPDDDTTCQFLLYAFIIKEENTGLLYSKGRGVAIMTRKPLPYWMIPAHTLYVKDTSDSEIRLTVSLHPVSPSIPSLTDEELSIYRSFHHKVFTDILSITPPVLKPDFDKATKDYIIVPVTINSPDGVCVEEIAIDFDCAGKIVSYYANGEKVKPSKPYTRESLNDCLVTPAHRGSTTPSGLQEVFRVEVDESMSPVSPFRYEKFPNFVEFFKTKYNYEILDLEQPALICNRVNTTFLKLFTSRYLNHEPVMKKTDVTMFPELVHLLPVSASFWRILRCLPAMLWRAESLLLANELAVSIREGKKIGCESFDTCLLTDTSVRGYADSGHGKLPSCRLKYLNDTIPEVTPLGDRGCDYFSRGPDNGLILQALTPKGANDSINLERLELLGDSFLKLVTSAYLYNTRPADHEGKLSEARSRRVSNVNLFVLGKKKCLTDTILSTDFNTGGEKGQERVRWIPPGYAAASEGSEERYSHHILTDKSVADTVEGLIGAHTVAGGLEGGIAFLKWMGLKIKKLNDAMHGLEGSSSNIDFSSCSLLFAGSGYVFSTHFGLPPAPSLPNTDMAVAERNRILPQVASIQRKIKYNFKNVLLLIEAMTHPSYTRNTITDCYQRLEFLGDAILDYLVTCHIYQSDASAEPGKMTELRSALVCNSRFAELAISLDLHKCLCHSSPPLFGDMRKYAEALKEKRSENLVHKFEDLSVIDDESAVVVLETDGSVEGDDDDDDDEEDSLEPPKSLSDCFEALAGAVFIDSGMSLQTVWESFSPLLDPLFEKFKDDPPVTPICMLHKLVPENLKVKKQVLYGNKSACIITVEGKGISEKAIARSYKNAKNAAAVKVLQKLKN